MKTRMELYLFIDALGWNIVREHGFCRELLPYQAKVRTQFGYSSGAVPTILSGKTPREHGHFSCFYYSPQTSPFRWMRLLPLALMPDALFNRHRIRHRLAKLIAKRNGYTGYFELYSLPYSHLPSFDYSEKNDIFAPGGLRKVPNLADVWQRQKRRSHISDWRLPSRENLRIGEELLRQGKTDSLFLYTAELDSFLHFHVSEPERVAEKLREYERAVMRLLEAASASGRECALHVISDHGMTPLAGACDLGRLLAGRGVRFGEGHASVLDSTMARFWIFDPQLRSRLAAALADAPGHFLSEAEKQRFGIDFPDRQYGDEIFLLDPGIQIAPSDMGRRPLPGMHGFTPDDSDSDAAFLSNVEPAEYPAWIGDYFTLMTSGGTDGRRG